MNVSTVDAKRWDSHESKELSGHTQKIKLNIHHVFKTEELFLKITTNRSGVSKSVYVQPTCTCNTILPYRSYFGSRTNMARGPTGGALAREYHALLRVGGVAVRQSIMCRYGAVEMCVCARARVCSPL
jgi:hypothetical protein